MIISTKVAAFIKNDKPTSAVVYKTPCGKCMRNETELDNYLLATKCQMPIDTFSFDPEILNVYDTYEYSTGEPMMDDVSNGVESVPIRVINEIDDNQPVFLEYVRERKPSQEVQNMINSVVK